MLSAVRARVWSVHRWLPFSRVDVPVMKAYNTNANFARIRAMSFFSALCFSFTFDSTHKNDDNRCALTCAALRDKSTYLVERMRSCTHTPNQCENS